jgi:hypothetical protein
MSLTDDDGNPTLENTHNLSEGTNSKQMKNSEWGATAYLATSTYGRGTTEMHINNCRKSDNTRTYNGRTGWGGASATAGQITTDCIVSDDDSSNNNIGAYHKEQGQHASTTDNIYGIYDMSGGNDEYVMGNFNNDASYSDFDPMPLAKYYNNYPQDIFSGNYYSNNDNCTWTTCGGHALHETKENKSVTSVDQSWGSDYSYFVESSIPWFIRGGSSGLYSYAGLFASRYSHGYNSNGIGFRVVLVLF